MPDFHLAQMNIGRMLYPLDDPRMAGFMNALDEINALADRTPGFVWRLQTEAGNATDLRPYEDVAMIVNMSVWESIEALFTYAYTSKHVEFLRRRREWFEKMAESPLVLWWVPAGHIPTVAEGQERIARLHRDGPTPLAFTFTRRFSPDGLPANES